MKKSVFSPDYRILCELLVEIRQQAQLTQVELAERLEETQSALSKAERGERRLDLVQLRTFSLACGTTLSKLVAEFERRVARSQR